MKSKSKLIVILVATAILLLGLIAAVAWYITRSTQPRPSSAAVCGGKPQKK